MSWLDIYDPVVPTNNEASVPKPAGLVRGIVNDINDKVTTLGNVIGQNRQSIADAEQQVLDTLHPVTRYIPVTYDTVKRISVISLCTFSGVLQGRRRGYFRRYMYPVLGFMGGNSACYPQQTFQTTSTVVTTTLPLVAQAGKVSVDGTVKLSSFIYATFKELFPDEPAPVVEETPVPVEAAPDIVLSEEATSIPVEVVLSEDAHVPVEVAADVVSNNDILETVEEVVLDSVEEVVLDSPADLAEVSEVIEASNTEVSVTESEPSSTDMIIPLDKLTVPEVVVPIKENLGMGDTEHDDMYSTRSATS